ncbi:sporulation protein YabP [Paenibacillus motobuensis]|uniref:Sporulation protein YabP n=2 Tax=Paenibacillus TaxID=44249 RepID=A0A3S9US29_9BACL|nr:MULTISPECIES: sporulation protein YabP [Paenibacillus]AZS13080.1 sporulation protein YabP [Paenibacillus lutimineralis]MCM3043082.1 sporulation protein YabP [Paenibacillus lutimineralis]MCM3650186.1 sporulation protein YabP [Paenibacillus motobuensis]NWL90208.1 sporulation protein YabP [Paenibacillus sp. 79R4]
MVEQGKGKRQELHLFQRKLLEISGVQNVESFDSEEFLLQTELGHLTIRGQNLHIKNLNLEQGLVSIEGLVNSLSYLEPGSHSSNKGFLGKLFR